MTTTEPSKLRVSQRYFGGTQQHGHMSIMAAGVHVAGRERGPGLSGFLKDRQSIHIGAEADRSAVLAAAVDNANNAGAADAIDDFVDPERGQLLGDEARGLLHIIENFRVLMKMAAPLRRFFLQLGGSIQDGHSLGS